MTDNELELLTTKEAAQFLRISPSAIHRMRKEGRLPFVQLGKKVFFTKKALVVYVNEQTMIFD